MSIKFVTATSIGPAHLEQQLANQDAVKCKTSNGFWATAVADGMGSRKFSGIGSKLAVNIAIDACMSSSFDISDKEIVTLIYSNWLCELKAADISSNDAVTTLLLTWGNNKGQFRYFQLGDGEIVSNLRQLSSNETDNFSNETTGLGISKKLSDWCIGSTCLAEDEKGITLMTDGISEDIDDHVGFSSSVISNAKGKSRRALKKKLITLLKAWPTPNHTDDKTIAVVIIND